MAFRFARRSWSSSATKGRRQTEAVTIRDRARSFGAARLGRDLDRRNPHRPNSSRSSSAHSCGAPRAIALRERAALEAHAAPPRRGVCDAAVFLHAGEPHVDRHQRPIGRAIDHFLDSLPAPLVPGVLVPRRILELPSDRAVPRPVPVDPLQVGARHELGVDQVPVGHFVLAFAFHADVHLGIPEFEGSQPAVRLAIGRDPEHRVPWLRLGSVRRHVAGQVDRQEPFAGLLPLDGTPRSSVPPLGRSCPARTSSRVRRATRPRPPGPCHQPYRGEHSSAGIPRLRDRWPAGGSLPGVRSG